MSSYAVERGFDHPIPTPADFVHDSLPGRVVFGAGASEQCLLPELDRLRLRSVLTVASRSQVGVAAGIEARLGPRCGGRVSLTDRSTRSELVAATVQAARTANADGLLVVGGGTAIGVAKSAAARAGLSIIALPTTYSGAELSPTYQADGDTRRSSPDALPGAIIYDPRLTFSLSDRLTSSSAMSALANGVEALCCLQSSPVSALIAQEGIRHIAEGARDSVLHRDGLVGRSITQFGGYLTGAAAAVTRPGVLQTVCEELARVASVRLRGRPSRHTPPLPRGVAPGPAAGAGLHRRRVDEQRRRARAQQARRGHRCASITGRARRHPERSAHRHQGVRRTELGTPQPG